jgi:hypothetical protein
MTYLIIGLIAVGLISYFLSFRKKNVSPKKSELPSSIKSDKDFPPKPKWKPNLPVDIELIYEKIEILHK